MRERERERDLDGGVVDVVPEKRQEVMEKRVTQTILKNYAETL